MLTQILPKLVRNPVSSISLRNSALSGASRNFSQLPSRNISITDFNRKTSAFGFEKFGSKSSLPFHQTRNLGLSSGIEGVKKFFLGPARVALPNAVQLANENPQSAEHQVAAMKLLEATQQYDQIIERFESGLFNNEECKPYFVNAAFQKKLFDKFEVNTSDNGSTVAMSKLTSNHIPFKVDVVQSKFSKYLSVLQLMLGVAVPGIIIILLYQLLNETNEKDDKDVITKAHSLAAKSHITFNDVKGVDQAKEDLQEVVAYLKDPEKFKKLGAQLPKGVLLVGEPGTGKTLLARAIAGEADVPFLYASGSSFDELYVGVGPKRVRDLFEDARKKAPCIIFLDEIDAVGANRKYQVGGSSSKESTLNQLLTEMDGFKQVEGVIVIAATNLPDILDPALTRPGRFDKQVVVPAPDFTGRQQILDLYLKKTKPAPDVNSAMLARRTTGFTGAELFNLINQAAIKAAVNGATHVDMKTIEEIRDDIIMGGKARGIAQSEEEKKLTAYHEGGHALVALYSDGSIPLHKATIISRGNSLGTTSFLPEKDVVSRSKKQLYSQLKVAMGGRAAEELIYGDEGITTGASSDFANATNLARTMVSRWGFSDKVGTIYHDGKSDLSETEKQLIDSEVKILLNKSYNDAKRILKEHEKELHLLAKSLLEHETLSAQDIQHVIKGKPLPKTISVPLDEEIKGISEEIKPTKGGKKALQA